MKRRISKILVPLDGSKNSLKGLNFATFIARQCNSTITGLYVVPFYLPLRGPKVFGPYRKQMLQQINKFMYEAKVSSAKKGIDFHEKIIEGDVTPHDIANYAKSKGFDLIVIASRGFGPVREMFLGSVAYSVLHKSKIPVLLVK